MSDIQSKVRARAGLLASAASITVSLMFSQAASAQAASPASHITLTPPAGFTSLPFPASTSARPLQETVLFRFQSDKTGFAPTGGMIRGPDGVLYGTTFGFEASTDGGSPCVAYSLTPPSSPGGAWQETILHRFDKGAGPDSSLTMDAHGNLFGTTIFSGKWHWGTVFELSPPKAAGGSWTYRTLHSFSTGSTGSPQNDGYIPHGPVVVDASGTIFGSTWSGGSDDMRSQSGSIYRLSPPVPDMGAGEWTETILYDFPANGVPYGAGPYGLITTPNGIKNANEQPGDLYGMTSGGGDPNCDGTGCGGVFRLAAPKSAGDPWTIHEVHAFAPGEGGNSGSSLYMDAAGNLFGVTFAGGLTGCSGSGVNGSSCGTVFKASPAATANEWSFQDIYKFSPTNDVYKPTGGVIGDASGSLFGVGSNSSVGNGGVFQLVPPSVEGGAWNETVLYQFQGGLDGEQPADNGGLVQDAKGVLYGNTSYGGNGCSSSSSSGCGTVFALGKPGVAPSDASNFATAPGAK